MSSSIERQEQEIETLQYLIPPEELILLPNNSKGYKVVQFRLVGDNYDGDYCPLLVSITLPSEYPHNYRQPSGRPIISWGYESVQMRSCPALMARNGWLQSTSQRTIIKNMIQLCTGDEILFLIYDMLKNSIPFPNECLSFDQQFTLDNDVPADDTIKDYDDSVDIINDINILSLESSNTPQLSTHHTEQPTAISPSSSSLQRRTNTTTTLTTNNNNNNNDDNDDPRILSVLNTMKLRQCDLYTVLSEQFNMIHISRFRRRKSLFETLLFPNINNYNDINIIKQLLYYNKDIADATHVCQVWSYPVSSSTSSLSSTSSPSSSSSSSIVYNKSHHNDHTMSLYPNDPSQYALGADEDGEGGAGSVMLEVIKHYKCNVYIVISRHFGGILLGPERFSIFQELTHDALVQGKYERWEDIKKRDNMNNIHDKNNKKGNNNNRKKR